MFNSLRETWFITKVESVIEIRFNALPPLLKVGIKGLAHAIVMNQFKESSFVFSVVDRKRLDPRIAALHCILTFIDRYQKNGQIIIRDEDFYGTLKIVCFGLIKEMQTTLVHPVDMAFVELQSQEMVRKHLPELFEGQ